MKRNHVNSKKRKMVMKSVVWRSGRCRFIEGNWRSPPASSFRYFSEDKGRILSEEERAMETVYIQKMERERMEKLKKKKADQEKAEKAKSHQKDEEEDATKI